MENKYFKLLGAVLLVALTTTLQAQIQTPAPSPMTKIEQMIGLTTVNLDYSRPSARGRDIFGSLVPYDQVWRTGANASTKISFSNEVSLNGNVVPAGNYALYTIPNESEWTVIIHKNTELWGSGGYDQKDDLLRFNVKPQTVSYPYETFTFAFSDMSDPTKATLNMMWENTMVSFEVQTNPDPAIMAQIQEQVINNDNPSANQLFAAAGYYFDNDKDLSMAHEWVKTANNVEEPRFWVVHLQAKIEAKLGMNAEAKKTAQKSLELAQAAGNSDYVRLNEKLMANL